MIGRDAKWMKASENELLNIKLSDLKLSIKSDFIQSGLNKLFNELLLKGLRVKPHCWLSDDWFSPDGVIGIAIPFFLAHPKLIELERKYIGEVEGGSEQWFMQLLRHEMGHVVDNAFGLRRRRKRQTLFGLSRTPYPKSYDPNPHSRKFVKHLDGFYAQAHPDEDWAETFAVWLDPLSNWRDKYKASKVVLSKLEYVEEVMEEFTGVKPKKPCYDKVAPVSEMNLRLATYFKRKLKRLNLNQDSLFHRDLNRIFTKEQNGVKASQLIKARRGVLTEQLSQNLKQPRYRIRRVLDTIINDCERDNLSVMDSDHLAEVKLKNLLEKKTKRFIQLGEHRIRM